MPFRLSRSDDWTPDMRGAADAYEAAVNAATGAATQDKLDRALAILKAARNRFGYALLLQDQKRRPEFYRL